MPPAHLTPLETALYAGDMLESLRKIADRQGLDLLPHLLELAKVEAKMLARPRDVPPS